MPHFLDSHFFGSSWKALPSDLSTPRLGERALTLLDDMANWGVRKRIMGEVDVFKIDSTHHMNINYVRLPSLPSFDKRDDLLGAVRRGDFFVSTGEVLLPEVKISAGSKDRIVVAANIRNNFPLQMAEIVWGDGKETYRKTFPLTDSAPFGTITFKGEADAKGWKWARCEGLEMGSLRRLGCRRQWRVRKSGLAQSIGPGRGEKWIGRSF
jgi:hypothetical protein